MRLLIWSPRGRALAAAARCGITTASSSASVDAEDVARFESLSQDWADEGGPFKALHSFNRLRLPWIRQNLNKDKPVSDQRVVDVGSGGGIVSVPLARLGLHVTGLDATEGAVAFAKKALQSPALRAQGIEKRIDYQQASVEDFSTKNRGVFDAVVASEIVEHVADVRTFVDAVCSLARPGAPIFFTTINKTVASRLLAIWMAEEVLGIVPRGVHDWRKFVPPDDLARRVERAGGRVTAVHGIAYNPCSNEWSWTSSTAVNYGLVARKL